HQLETQKDQIGVENIGLAIGANAAQAALQILAPYFGAVHAELAWKSQQGGNVLQARAAAALKARQNVHEVHVPPVKTAQVIAEPEAVIGIAHLPVACCSDAVEQAAIVQHGQV